MARKVQQFRYYSENSTDNYPNGIMNKDNLTSNNIFTNFGNIKQLGIQTMPGVKFRLNSTTSENWITVGVTGIYELDLEDLIDIVLIQFDENSVDVVSESVTGYIIIDILYDKEDE